MKGLAEARDDVRVVKLRRNFGKAAALSHGFAAARGDYLVTMDGDRQDDPAEIANLTAPLSRGLRPRLRLEAAPAGPAQQDAAVRASSTGPCASASGIPLHDFNCGLKAYKRDVVDTISIYGELHRYIPVVAAQAGFQVTEVKVSHRRRTAGRSKYGWQRYMRGYLDLLTVMFLGRYQHRPQHLFGGFGTLLIFIGVLVELYLTIDKLVFGNPIGQRPLLLLGALLIIVGVQLLSLGLIGELIANSRARQRPGPGAGGRAARSPERRPTAPEPPAMTAGTPPRGAPPEPPHSRDPGRRVLRDVRAGLSAQRRAHRGPPRARRRGPRVPRRAAAADRGRDGRRARSRAPRRRRRRGARAARSRSTAAASRWTRSSSATRATSSCRSGACSPRVRHARLVFDPLVSLLDTFAGDRGLVRSGGAKAAAVRAVDEVAFRLPHLVLADTWAHAAYYQEAFGLAREPAGRGAGGRAAGAARGRRRADAGARRAAHRPAVRQVEPAARRRRRARRRRAAARRAVPLRAHRRGTALRRAARRPSPRAASPT